MAAGRETRAVETQERLGLPAGWKGSARRSSPGEEIAQREESVIKVDGAVTGRIGGAPARNGVSPGKKELQRGNRVGDVDHAVGVGIAADEPRARNSRIRGRSQVARPRRPRSPGPPRILELLSVRDPVAVGVPRR